VSPLNIHVGRAILMVASEGDPPVQQTALGVVGCRGEKGAIKRTAQEEPCL